MAAVLKVKRRLDQDPAEALIVHFDTKDAEALFRPNHHGCTYRKRPKRENNLSVINSITVVASDSGANYQKRVTEEGNFEPNPPNGAQFDYLTTFAEDDVNLTSSVVLARQLKKLLHERDQVNERRIVTVKRRVTAHSATDVVRIGERVAKTKQLFPVASLSVITPHLDERNKTFTLGSCADFASDEENLTVDGAVSADDVTVEHHNVCRSSFTCHRSSRYDSGCKTYLLKRKFRQLMDADDVDMINTNICALSMTAVTPFIDAENDDVKRMGFSAEFSMLGKRRRSDITATPDHAAEKHAENCFEPETVNRSIEQSGCEEQQLNDSGNAGEQLLHDCCSTTQPVPIFLGELEDWDAIYDAADTHRTRKASSKTNRGTVSSDDKDGSLCISGTTKNAEAEDTVSEASITSAVSTPALPVEPVAATSMTPFAEEELGIRDAVVLSDDKRGDPGFVYDMYVRRITEPPAAAAIPSVLACSSATRPELDEASSSIDVRTTAARLLRTLRQSNLSSQALYDRYCSEGADETAAARLNDDDEEQNYADINFSAATANHECNIDNIMEFDVEARRPGTSRREQGDAASGALRSHPGGEILTDGLRCFSREAGSSIVHAGFSPVVGSNSSSRAPLAPFDAGGNVDTGNESIDDNDLDNQNFYADELSYDRDGPVQAMSRYADAQCDRAMRSGGTLYEREERDEEDYYLVADAEHATTVSNNTTTFGPTFSSHRRRRRYNQQQPSVQRCQPMRGNNSSRYPSRRAARLLHSELNVVADNDNNDDESSLLSSERRSTLPALVDAVDNNSRLDNADVRARRVSRRYSELLVNNIRGSGGDLDEMDQDTDDDDIADVVTSENRRIFARNLPLHYRMQPIILASRQMESGEGLDDAGNFQLDNNGMRFISRPPHFGGGNEDYISLARFGRSGRRNVIAPTPAPIMIGSTLHSPTPVEEEGNIDNGHEQSYSYYYGDDVDDEDFFAHMSNGEDSPHPDSDTENEDGDDEGEYEIEPEVK